MKKWTLGQAGKTKPIQTQYKPNTKPIQTQYKANTNPIQTQFRRQKNADLHLYTVGYLRKKWYSVTLLTGNIRLISHLTAKEKTE